VAVAAGPGGDSPKGIRVLLSAGADVNATTSDGASALDISRVAAARHRTTDAGRATGHDVSPSSSCPTDEPPGLSHGVPAGDAA
jgi:hypothetical protein